MNSLPSSCDSRNATPTQLLNLIPERLSPRGRVYWDGLCGEGQNEAIIEAQRDGIDAAVATVEELALPESE